MPNLNSKNKHLTADNRREIMECLDKGMTFKAIGTRVSKDPTTISKEVKKHLYIKGGNTVKLVDADGLIIGKKRCPLLSLTLTPFLNDTRNYSLNKYFFSGF